MGLPPSPRLNQRDGITDRRRLDAIVRAPAKAEELLAGCGLKLVQVKLRSREAGDRVRNRHLYAGSITAIVLPPLQPVSDSRRRRPGARVCARTAGARWIDPEN